MKRLILLTFILLFVAAQTSTTQSLAAGPTEVPRLEDQQAPTDSTSKTSASQDRCESFDQFKQKRCCYRAKKIKDLQKEEFSLVAKDGQDLFELQQKYDQTLADLKIHEGILELQEDYLKFMERLDNPSSEDEGLSKLKRLEANSREAIDNAYRMKFLHDAMDELKSETGVFSDDKGKIATAENLYLRAGKKCQESKNVDGLCTLINPQSEFNQKSSTKKKVSATEIKKMMKNFLMSYGVATENLSKEELKERNTKYEKSLKQIPLSVLEGQIKTYKDSQKKLEKLFSQEENKGLKHIYSCIKKIRYEVPNDDCKSNMTNEDLVGPIESITQKVLDHSRKIVGETGLSKTLDTRQIKALNESITQKEKETFEEVFNLVENKLKLAASISKRRAREEISQEDFFSDFDNDPRHKEVRSLFMKRLCGEKGQTFNSSEMLKCIDGTEDKDKLKSKREIAEKKKKIKNIQQQIDQVTSGDEYQRLNSFKNYYAHKTKDMCSSEKEEESLIKTTGQCYLAHNGSEEPVTRLLDTAGRVIAEVQFKDRGGLQRGIEELTRIHEFCYELEEEERAKYDHECKMASSNYIEATTDYSELNSDTKEYISENMAFIDPQTGEISYQKRRSTWSMIALNGAGALASSVPTFMNYHQRKMGLPFMADQAKFQKTLQYFQQQNFDANFFRPGGFNSFGRPGGPNYGIAPFSSFPSFGGRVPIGPPQSLNIP
jgi:hypothetical protein